MSPKGVQCRSSDGNRKVDLVTKYPAGYNEFLALLGYSRGT